MAAMSLEVKICNVCDLNLMLLNQTASKMTFKIISKIISSKSSLVIDVAHVQRFIIGGQTKKQSDFQSYGQGGGRFCGSRGV